MVPTDYMKQTGDYFRREIMTHVAMLATVECNRVFMLSFRYRV